MLRIRLRDLWLSSFLFLGSCAVFGLLTSANSFAAPSDSCQAGKIKMSDGKDMYFRLYVPRKIAADKKYPLVMCLHGIGECGSDNKAQVDREYMSNQWNQDSVKQKYSPFVLYPQCPSSSYEWGYFNTGTAQQKGYAGLPSQAAIKVIDSLIKIYPIDTTRLYVGGLSWGGLGTEAIMMTYPDKFAAAFPCAGENKLNTVSVMTKTPFWIFHGASDGTVPVTLDQQLVAACISASFPVVKIVSTMDNTFHMTNPSITIDSLNKAVSNGSLYLYAEIKNGNHNSGWQECFYAPQLVPWIMSKSKVNKTTKFTWPAPGPSDGVVQVAQKLINSSVRSSLQVSDGIIRWSGVVNPSQLSIFSAEGRLVRQTNISTNAGSLSYAGLPSGTYYAAINGSSGENRSSVQLTVLPK